MPRAVAQLGSALDWGSRGRRFKSCQPDRKSLMRSNFHQGFVVSERRFLWSPSGPPGQVGMVDRWMTDSAATLCLWIRGPKGDQNDEYRRRSRLQSASGALPWPSWSLRAGVSAEEGVGLFRGGGEVAVIGVEVAASGLD